MGNGGQYLAKNVYMETAEFFLVNYAPMSSQGTLQEAVQKAQEELMWLQAKEAYRAEEAQKVKEAQKAEEEAWKA